jgi:hypothetical protein
MRVLRCSATSLLAFAATAVSASAQKTTQTGVGGGGSPHVTTEWTLGGANVSISYGRPSLKGRAESKMMPAGKVWRTGADEATVITTDKPLTFGSVTLAPGSYTINTEPGATAWQIIFGKLAKPGQWGIPYKPGLEIGRAPMTLGTASAPVEQLTYSIDGTSTGGVLRIEWGTTSVSTPFTIGE